MWLEFNDQTRDVHWLICKKRSGRTHFILLKTCVSNRSLPNRKMLTCFKNDYYLISHRERNKKHRRMMRWDKSTNADSCEEFDAWGRSTAPSNKQYQNKLWTRFLSSNGLGHLRASKGCMIMHRWNHSVTILIIQYSEIPPSLLIHINLFTSYIRTFKDGERNKYKIVVNFDD